MHYKGGGLRIFYHVEATGISLFEMDRILENQLQTVSDKKYHILIKEYGFRLLRHNRELHANCADHFDYSRMVDLYVEISFSDLLASQ